MRALIAIDLQNDFFKGGALGVPGADNAFVQVVNQHMHDDRYSVIAMSADDHPPDHVSFGEWPPHCIRGTIGAEFHPLVASELADVIIRKGRRQNMDSYSAFLENDRRTRTGLASFLKERGVIRCDFIGLAREKCVHFSAFDATRMGFEVTIIDPATRALYSGQPGDDLYKARVVEEAMGIAVQTW